jgi:hypothetical protein
MEVDDWTSEAAPAAIDQTWYVDMGNTTRALSDT